jgi:protein gp37
MADKSGIQWTDATWNPTTGCDRVSPGCANCYALTFAPRLQAMAIAMGKHVEPTDPYMRNGDAKTSGVGFGLLMHESRIFVNSMSDLFHPEVTDAFLDRVFAVMALASQHVFQVLTKRPERMREYMADVAYRTEQVGVDAEYRSGLARYDDDGTPTWPFPLANVWLGTSVENARWRTRIDELRQTPAAVRFLSCEPLLGPLHTAIGTVEDRRGTSGRNGAGVGQLNLTGIDWVIVGGESGPGARELHEEWVRDIVDACRGQGSAPFVKQMGEVWSREHLGHGGHAGDIERFPADLRVREWPAAA